MSKHGERAPLYFRPGTSRGLAGFLILTHAAAAAAIAPLPIPWYARAGLLALVVASLGYQGGMHLLRRLPWAVREALLESEGSWVLTLASGRRVEALLLPSSFLSAPVIVLNFRRDRWLPCALVLTSDSVDPDLLRRLRVRLRTVGASVSSAPDTAV